MLTSIENPDAFFVNNGIGIPSSLDATSDSTVILEFLTRFEGGIKNQISIHGAKDVFGNSLDNFVMDFTYYAPYVIEFGDILITEIMADPTPGVDLPEFEYLEIYNPKSETFDLNQVKLIVGDNTTYIPDLSIDHGEYIILCQHAAEDHLRAFGRTEKIINWPSLNNQGEQIQLLNSHEEIVFSISYEDNWYKSIEKDDGGYSLEMIDADFPCKGEENWIASADPSGGTPGRQNSINEKMADLKAPEIESIVPVSNTALNIQLTERIGPLEVDIQDFSISPPLVIYEAELILPGFTEFRLECLNEITPRTEYELTLKNIVDCAGNIQKTTSGTFLLPEQAYSLDLIINELLFNPKPNGVDFVEIFNKSEKYIDLNNISLFKDNFFPISQKPFIIEPGQILAITEDPNLLQNHHPSKDLNNVISSMNIPAYNYDQGEVILTNLDGKIIDYFQYDEAYHSIFLNDVEGVSLERISYNGSTSNPNNWQSTAETAGYATPGAINSQHLSSSPESENVTVDPKVLSPGSTGFQNYTMIKCRFSTAVNIASILILNPTGRQIKSIASHQSVGVVENFKWEGLDEDSQEVRLGPYVVYIEVYNPSRYKKIYREKVVEGKNLN